MSNIAYRKDIDALRGLSVILVVLYHAFPTLLPGGFVGVDIFFVISGFLITQIISAEINNSNFSILNFYSRRIRRILPPLLTILTFSLAAGWLVLFQDEYKQLGNHVSQTILFVQNFNLIEEQGYFDVSSHYKPLLHLWSLSVEEQYYLLWPILLYLILRAGMSPAILLVLIMGFSFFANIYYIADYKEEVFYHTGSRIWEIALGSLLAIIKHKYTQLVFTFRYSRLLFVFGMFLILVAALFADGDSLYPYWWGLLPTSGAMSANLQNQYWGGLVNVGLISYPLYLWHWVILSFCYIYLGKQPETGSLLIAIIISVFLSFLTFRYIEKIRYSSSKLVVPGLIIGAAMIGVIGLAIDKNNGLPMRAHLAYLSETNLEFVRTPPSDDACDEYVTSRTNAERKIYYCRASFDEKNERMLAVIGDSHAHAIYPGIAEVAKKHGYNTILLANSSCPPLIGYKWGRNEKERIECQTKISQIMAVLRSDPKITKIVFATRGPVYIHGEVEGKFTRTSVEANLKNVRDPLRQTYSTYFSGFEKSLHELNSIKHIQNIYYFLENPELDFLPKEVVPRPFDYLGLSTQATSVSRNLYQLRMKSYRDYVYKAATTISNVRVIDVEPYLCSFQKCVAFDRGQFLYADDDHFSVFGSEYIAGKAEKILFDDE